MEWYIAAIIILGGLLLLMVTGLPIAFCFLIITALGSFLWWGGETGLGQLIRSFTTGLTTFTLLPLPLFILMGEVMFQSKLAPDLIDALDNWLGRLPGRLSLLAVVAGTLLSTLTGASIASVAILGSTLVPEMEKRGYKKPMSIGPILGSGGLAIMIPPSALGVLLAAIGEISVGKLLIAIIMPGLLMAVLYTMYIVLRCRFQPHLAPPYTPAIPSMREKLSATSKYILPLGFIIFLVTGLIFLGVATPSEAAAAGALGTFILAAAHGRLKWQMVKDSFTGTMTITVMTFLIIAGAISFGQILAFSGVTTSLVKFFSGLPVAPILVLISMEFAVLIMGMFMAATAVIMVALPLFMPVVYAMGFDPVWFGAITLINIEMATTSPPFGMGLYVMKGVAPPDTTMGDCYRAAIPFLGCDLIAIAVVMAFPLVAMWLPGIMR